MGHDQEVLGIPVGTNLCGLTDNNPLSHLDTAKVGVTEQWWVAQLAVFNYSIHYCPWRTNQNADSLSRQLNSTTTTAPGPGNAGTLLSLKVQQAAGNAPTKTASTAAISTLPECSPDDIVALLAADPAKDALLLFWLEQRMPGCTEKQGLPPETLGLLHQWGQLILEEGLLYRLYRKMLTGQVWGKP